MKKRSKENVQIQVGAFIAIGILLTMAAIFVLGSRTSLFKTQYTLICYFDDISGLRVGAPVQLAGVNAGFIDQIEFEERAVEESKKKIATVVSVDEKKKKKTIVKVRVTLQLNKEYQDRIRADSVASVVTQGVLGDRMIFISVGSKDTKRLKDGDEIIKVKNPSGFTQLVEKSDDLIIDTKKFVRNTNDLVTKLNLVMNEVIQGQGLAHDVIYEKSSGEVLASINDILDQFGIAGRNLSSITGKINEGEGTLGALVNDAALYNDIKMLFGKANRNRLIRSVIRYTLQTREKEQLK